MEKEPCCQSWDDFEKHLHRWSAKDKSQTAKTEFLNVLKGMN